LSPSHSAHALRARAVSCLCVAIGLACSVATAAEGPEPSGINGEPKRERVVDQRIERARRAISTTTQSLAQRFDDLFDDPNLRAEAAQTRFKLRQSGSISARDPSDYGARVSARIALPNLSDRINLLIAGNEDVEPTEIDEEQLLDQPRDDSLDNPTIGLQYVVQKARALHTSFTVGARVSNPSVNFGPRFRYQHQIGTHWRGKYMQRIVWDTKDEWELRNRIDFDRKLGERYLFRQTLRTDWRDKRRASEGTLYTWQTSFFRTLGDNAAVSFSYTSRYVSRPAHRWVSHTLSTHYRRLAYADWVFVEVSPFLGFSEEHDWDANPGIQLTLDLVFED
jgi:hypothetical protein